MDEPLMVPEWIVLLVGKKELELEGLRRENERLREEQSERDDN